MRPMARTVSLNAAAPETLSWRGRNIRTGIFKEPVAERRIAGRYGISGDHVQDRRMHGGEEQAVYAYPSEHYRYWRETYPGLVLNWGAFGENLTTAGLLEQDVHVGDRFRLGESELEVSTLRIPCFKLGRRMGQPGFVRAFLASGRCGWYLRVVCGGEIGPDDRWEQVSSGPGQVSIAELVAMFRDPGFDPARMAAAARVPALPDSWREQLVSRLARMNMDRNPGGRRGPA